MTDPEEEQRLAELEEQRLAELYEKLRLQLLDLSKRNRMLNYRLGARSKRHVQIVDEVLDEVFRRLVTDDSEMRVAFLKEPDEIPSEERTEDFISALEHAKVSDAEYLTKLEEQEEAGRDDEAALAALDRELRNKVRNQLGLPPRLSRAEVNRLDHARSLGIDPGPELPARCTKPSHEDELLQTLKYPDELESVMEKIASDARLAEQEMGMSTLFLAFGFLEWYESEVSDKAAHAPLLLLPVKVVRQKPRGKSVYYVSATGEGAEANLSLHKLLELEYNRDLPDFQSGDDESSEPVERYLESAGAAIEGLKRWRVHRRLVLGHFAFGRFLMYIDLRRENWRKDRADHVLVNAILKGSEGDSDGPLLPPISDDHPVDDPKFEMIAPFLIHDADASQHSALIDAMSDKNLVIQGPPGTGKSQTIANLIANALAAGKRVLFLSEKQAALDVVKRRLDTAGLGEFCLELHSDRASPKSVIESLKRRQELGWGRRPRAPAPDGDTARNESRAAVKSYLDALHDERPDGSTAFALIWRALRGWSDDTDAADAVRRIALPATLLDYPGAAKKVRGKLRIFTEMATSFTRNFGRPAESPWATVAFASIAHHEAARLIDMLGELRNVVARIREYCGRYSGVGASDIADIEQLIYADRAIGEPPDGLPLAKLAALDLDELEKCLAAKRRILDLDTVLSQKRDLASQPRDRLAVAINVVRQGAPPDLLHKTPEEAYSLAGGAIVELSSTVEGIDGLSAALGLLGFSAASSAKCLFTIATSAVLASEIAPRLRPWISRLRTTDPIAFAGAYSKWRELVAAEQRWREKLSAVASAPWPPSADIEAAADTLRKGRLGRALGMLRGRTRSAHELRARLGLADGPSAAPELCGLAIHVRALEEFEADRQNSLLLGAAWAGMATPFEEIAAAIEAGASLRSRLTDLPQGDEIAMRVLSLAPDVLATLGNLAVPGRKVLAVSRDVKAQFEEEPIDASRSRLHDGIALLRKFLEADPQRVLIGLEDPVQVVAEVAEAAAEREKLAKSLSSSPLAQEIEDLGASTIAEIGRLNEGINWLRSVRRASAPPQLGQALMSSQVAEARRLLREVALEGAELYRSYRSIAARCESECGLTELGGQQSEAILSRLKLLLSHKDELADFMALSGLRQGLERDGLSEFLSATDRLALPADRLPKLFETLVSQLLADHARRGAHAIRSESGAELDGHRKVFADLDRAKKNADRAAIRDRLLEKVPYPGSSSGPKKTWTEMPLLRNEFEKQKRFAPVRDLLARARGSIQILKPCFMMSPLSLAKFLRPGEIEFDLLVIDEASQIRPEDALGGLLRAKQLVVVGDAKQLPPTDFFTRSVDATLPEDEFEDVDAESILEACQRTFRETRRLKWHYRSRCESLIAFSNREFYENSLITFPTARPGSFSVDLIRVDGFYRARRNPEEAARIAEEAVRFMRRFADESDEATPTLGLVAINIEQRDLIQEELCRLSAGDELVERYQQRVEKKGEPVFVKNLENVQGDERDYIFISLTYGREPGATAVKQRFGPINGKQGHRRLNVLFSRARVRIGLFTSLGSADVKPSETSAEGLHVLKRYLEYTENRGRAPVERVGSEPESDFEIEVGERLRAAEYRVEFQVGVSGYRIDLGVRHPDHPERFVAGIECDGARYHSSKSARDRDRLREEVLRGLGWTILRVWSTDWFDNPGLETRKLVKRLEDLRARPQRAFGDYCIAGDIRSPVTQEFASCPSDSAGTEDATSDVVEVYPAAPAPASLLEDYGPLTEEQAFAALRELRDTVIARELNPWEPHRSILRDAMIETFVRQRITDPEDWFAKVPQFQRVATNPVEKKLFLEQICEIIRRIADDGPLTPGPSPTGAPPRPGNPTPEAGAYAVVEMGTIGVTPAPERFYEPAYASVLRRMVAHVIEVEGPIYQDVLVTRIARAHGFQRAGGRIREAVLAAVDRRFPRTMEGGRRVFWKQGSETSLPVPYRRGSMDVRPHADIPIPELAGLALPYVRLRMTEEQILEKMSREFGLGRLRELTRAKFVRAISLAQTAAQPGGRAARVNNIGEGRAPAPPGEAR